jgi:flagellar basal body P-ring formation chaperone FlgA
VIARFTFGRFLFAFGILATALLPVELAAERSRTPPDARSTPVTRQEVRQAVEAELRQRGLAESQLPRVEDLDLPVAIPALAGRRLRVSSSCWDAGLRRTQFRLECGEPGQCLPFLVYVHGDVYDALNADAGAPAGSCRPAWGARLASGSRPVPEASLKPAVRAGDRALVVFAAEGLRMTASVTCLDRGREGAVIRVRTQDGVILRARISRVSYQGITLAMP